MTIQGTDAFASAVAVAVAEAVVDPLFALAFAPASFELTFASDAEVDFDKAGAELWIVPVGFFAVAGLAALLAAALLAVVEGFDVLAAMMVTFRFSWLQFSLV